MNQLEVFLTVLFVLTFLGMYGVISFMAYFEDNFINGDEDE
jgi:hypothetical protein